MSVTISTARTVIEADGGTQIIGAEFVKIILTVTSFLTVEAVTVFAPATTLMDITTAAAEKTSSLSIVLTATLIPRR